jgi:hypothetical protein
MTLAAAKAAKLQTQLGTTLKTLLGRAVTAGPGKPAPIPPACVVANFVRDDGALEAVVVAGIPIASFLGAGLALIPPAVATQASKGSTLDPNLGENYAEVMNVVTNILIDLQGAHLKFKEIAPRASAPKDVAALIAKPAARADVEVNVSGYGAGPMTFLFAKP